MKSKEGEPKASAGMGSLLKRSGATTLKPARAKESARS